MEVLITGCSKETYWYNGRIGQIFNITKESDTMEAYECSHDKVAIFKKDCHVIQSIATVLTEWETNGGELQLWGQNFKTWIKIEDGHKFLFCLNSILRIKPVKQPQYRPYTFAEAKEVFVKDGFGVWVKSTDTSATGLVCYVSDTGVSIPGIGGFLFESLLQYCTHLDGTPCGVKIN